MTVASAARAAPVNHTVAPAARKAESGVLSLETFGWNVGGSGLDCLASALSGHLGGCSKEGVGLLQCPRGKVGWSSTRQGCFSVLVHRGSRDSGEG